jgi:DNA-directed RNA polymerase specialized sigma24 family protein
MAPATMRTGYSESSNTRFRHYGRAAAWTGTPPASSPPASSPPASPEPRGRQVLTTVRASLGADAWPKASRVQPAGCLEDVAGKPPGAGRAALSGCRAERCLTAIGEMPGIRRRVAYLRFHEGWANRLIAGHLGTRPGTAAKHVSDACADLKKALPELAMADDPGGALLAGRRHHEPEGRCGYRARAGSAVCR